MSLTTKITSYALSERGIHVSQDYATGWIYFFVGILIWIALGFLLPISLLIAFVIAIPVTIVLVFIILRLSAINNFFHRRRMISWESVLRAEMKKNKIVFTFREGTYRAGHGKTDEITVTVKNGKEVETQQFLEKMLSDRFIVLE